MNRREPVRIWVWGDGETWAGWSQKRMNDASTPYLRESASILRECPVCETCGGTGIESTEFKNECGCRSIDECEHEQSFPAPCPACANGCGECLRCELNMTEREAYSQGLSDGAAYERKACAGAVERERQAVLSDPNDPSWTEHFAVIESAILTRGEGKP